MTILEWVEIEYLTFLKNIIRSPWVDYIWILPPFWKEVHTVLNETDWNNWSQTSSIWKGMGNFVHLQIGIRMGREARKPFNVSKMMRRSMTQWEKGLCLTFWNGEDDMNLTNAHSTDWWLIRCCSISTTLLQEDKSCIESWWAGYFISFNLGRVYVNRVKGCISMSCFIPELDFVKHRKRIKGEVNITRCWLNLSVSKLWILKLDNKSGKCSFEVCCPITIRGNNFNQWNWFMCWMSSHFGKQSASHVRRFPVTWCQMWIG